MIINNDGFHVKYQLFFFRFLMKLEFSPKIVEK